MGSREFQITTVNEEPVDLTSPFISDELKLHQASIYAKLYDSSGSITNTTHPIHLFMPDDEEPQSENVFICLTKEGNTKNMIFTEYFISEEYNMNIEGSDSLSNHIAGRFVFEHVNERIQVRAIAEEPAKALFTSEPRSDMEQKRISLEPEDNVEILYLRRRREHELKKHLKLQSLEGDRSASYEPKHPLCELTDAARYRLCGLIFNSEYFDGRIKFPATNSVPKNFDCEEKEVSFRSADARKQAVGEHYQESMLLCHVSSDNYAEDVDTSIKKIWNEYFVSRAYNNDSKNALSSNDVFVYRQETDGIYLVNAFTNVRLKSYDKRHLSKL